MGRSVMIVQNGRDGSVRYADGLRSIEGYWAFGGNDVVTIVSMGSRDDWAQAHEWAVDQRAGVLRFVADEVIRQRAPTCVAEIDELGGHILLRIGGAGRAGAVSRPSAAATRFVHRIGALKSMLALGVLALALVVGGLAWIGKSALSVAPAHGVPLGDSVRTDTHVVSLIRNTDAHLPRWSGRGGNDAVSISVLLIPLDGTQPQRVSLASGLAPNAFSLARVLGSDGHTLWLDVAGLRGLRVRDLTLVTVADLRAANAQLDPGWWDDQRGIDVVDGVLHVMRPDRSAALDVDPATLAGRPVTPRPPSAARFLKRSPDDLLAAGFLMPDGRWLGLHAPSARQGMCSPGAWVRAVERADDATEVRRLFLGTAEAAADGDHHRIRTMAAVSDADYLDAAFLRLSPESAPVPLEAPAGTLMVHTSRADEGAAGTGGTLVVSRVDQQGSLQWQVDTGLDRFRLRQVLPGAKVSVFVGERPPAPGKLADALVVLLDNSTGKLVTHALR